MDIWKALAYFQDLLTFNIKSLSTRSEVGNAVEFQKKCEDLQDKVSGLQKEIQRMVRILLDLIWEDQLH